MPSAQICGERDIWLSVGENPVEHPDLDVEGLRILLFEVRCLRYCRVL